MSETTAPTDPRSPTLGPSEAVFSNRCSEVHPEARPEARPEADPEADRCVRTADHDRHRPEHRTADGRTWTVDTVATIEEAVQAAVGHARRASARAAELAAHLGGLGPQPAEATPAEATPAEATPRCRALSPDLTEATPPLQTDRYRCTFRAGHISSTHFTADGASWSDPAGTRLTEDAAMIIDAAGARRSAEHHGGSVRAPCPPEPNRPEPETARVEAARSERMIAGRDEAIADLESEIADAEAALEAIRRCCLHQDRQLVRYRDEADRPEPERRHLEVRAAAERPCAFARCRAQISEGARAVVGAGPSGRPVLYHEGCYADALRAATLAALEAFGLDLANALGDLRDLIAARFDRAEGRRDDGHAA